MIVRARTVVTMDGPPIDNGAVATAKNQIIDVGTFNDIKTSNAGETLDLGEQALLPGLINAHCHLDYTCLRGKIPPQKSFVDWIRAINSEKAKLSPNDYVASINEGFTEAKRFGTTTIANLTACPELVAQIEAPIRTWWFAELIDVRTPERARDLVDRAIKSLRSSLECADMSALSKRRYVAAVQAQHSGLAPHALFTASQNLYRRCEQIAAHQNVGLATHLAESGEEMEMFRHASGPLYEFMKSLGRPMDDCGKGTPLERFLTFTDFSRPSHEATAWQVSTLPAARNGEHWLIAHLNELTESDFELLANWQVRLHVVHCPRSHNYFGHARFPFERLRLLGVNISLGTDSLASNSTLSLFDEMRVFQTQFPSVSAEQIFQMVTVNPARALRQKDVLGKLCRGARADFLAVPCNSNYVFDEIVAFEGEPWIMIAGTVQAET